MLKTSHEEIHPNSLNEKDFNILIRKTPFERDSKNRLSRSVNKDPIKQENPLTKPDSCPTSPSSKQPKITGILKKGVRRKYVNSQTEKASELLYKSDLTYERKYEKLALEYLFPDYNVESDDPLVNPSSPAEIVFVNSSLFSLFFFLKKELFNVKTTAFP